MAIVNLGVTDERRKDMLVGALEGGSNYWYWLGNDAMKVIEPYRNTDNRYIHEAMFDAMKDGKVIPINDAENPEEKIGEISWKSMDEGEQLMANSHLDAYMRIIAEEDDANDADIWFQYCALKEITYG